CEVSAPDGPAVRFHADLERTAAGLDHSWPGSGRTYVAFVKYLSKIFQRIQPLQWIARPGVLDLLRTGAWKNLLFLFRSLRSVLARSGLPAPVVEALGVWTHVAGQTLEEAPSPFALVPPLIRGAGTAYRADGMGAIPRALAAIAEESGVVFRHGTRVRALHCEQGRVTGVETERGEYVAADAVVCNAGGIGVYLELLRET